MRYIEVDIRHLAHPYSLVKSSSWPRAQDPRPALSPALTRQHFTFFNKGILKSTLEYFFRAGVYFSVHSLASMQPGKAIFSLCFSVLPPWLYTAPLAVLCSALWGTVLCTALHCTALLGHCAQHGPSGLCSALPLLGCALQPLRGCALHCPSWLCLHCPSGAVLALPLWGCVCTAPLGCALHCPSRVVLCTAPLGCAQHCPLGLCSVLPL